MEAHFQVFEDQSSEWRWHFVGANGEIMAASEAYTRKQDAIRGVDDFLQALHSLAAESTLNHGLIVILDALPDQSEAEGG